MIYSGVHYLATPRNLLAGGAVAWKEVDEGWIRYDIYSGSTQLLLPLARFVIDLLEVAAKSLSFYEMVDAVLDAEPQADRADCEVEMEAVLRILCEHQLIQKALP